MSSVRWLVLDAMGVIYRARDDVAELLIPYLREIDCQLTDREIEHLYRETSLGRLTSSEFWRQCGVDGDDAEVLAAVEAVLVSTGRSLAGSGLSVAEAALRRLNREER